MPGDAEEPADLRIELSARQIAQLTRSLAARGRDSLGVLRPFSGLLLASRQPRFDHPAPPLAYLTLQPLVVEHLRERTHRDTETVTVERIESTDGAAADDDGTAPDSPESMTVREFIKQQANGNTGNAVGDRGFLASEREAPDPVDGSQRDSDPRVTFGDGPRLATDQDIDAGLSIVSPTHSDRPPQIHRESSPVRSTGRGRASPQTTLDAIAQTRADSPARPSRTSGPGRRLDVGAAGTESGRRSRVGSGPGDVGPELVLAAPPITTGTAAEEARSGASSLTVQSGDQPRPPSTSDEDRRDRHGAHAGSVGSGPHAVNAASGPSGASPSAVGRERDDTMSDPTAVLDDLDRPDLDRFVERLSDELARHERIERERRGG